MARHIWPATHIVNDLEAAIHNFVWMGNLTVKRATNGKAILDRRLSQQPVTAGGVGISNIRHELIALAAKSVEIWATKTCGLSYAIGAAFASYDILRNDPLDVIPRISITWKPDTKQLWNPSLWTIGAKTSPAQWGLPGMSTSQKERGTRPANWQQSAAEENGRQDGSSRT